MKVILKGAENEQYEIYRVERNFIIIITGDVLTKVPNKDIYRIITDDQLRKKSKKKRKK